MILGALRSQWKPEDTKWGPRADMAPMWEVSQQPCPVPTCLSSLVTFSLLSHSVLSHLVNLGFSRSSQISNLQLALPEMPFLLFLTSLNDLLNVYRTRLGIIGPGEPLRFQAVAGLCWPRCSFVLCRCWFMGGFAHHYIAAVSLAPTISGPGT